MSEANTHSIDDRLKILDERFRNFEKTLKEMLEEIEGIIADVETIAQELSARGYRHDVHT